jgi:uncharacterized membrane protein YdfJ with MMPL/SSD domain
VRSPTPSGGTLGDRLFGGLARGVVRHPWYPVLFWVALLVVVVPFLPLLGSVTTNSTETVPSNAPSSVAAAEFARVFPNETGDSSSLLLLTGSNLTDPSAQAAVENVTSALLADRSLQDVASVSSVYTSEAAYLAGQAELAAGAIATADRGPTGFLVEFNATVGLVWGPPSLYWSIWDGLVANSSAPPSHWNYPAYAAAEADLSGNATLLDVLSAFYAGENGSGAGFNGSADCAAAGPAALSCADGVTRSQVGRLVPSLFPEVPQQSVAFTALGRIGIENATAWPSVRSAAASGLAPELGLPDSWVDTVWEAFPAGSPSPTAALAWANGTVSASTLWTAPLAIPRSLLGPYVNAAGTASIVVVGFSVSDSYTNASGGQPVYADLPRILARAQAALSASDPTRAISLAQTGAAPLDLLEQTAVSSSLELVLPLTVGLLLLIAMLYFRSPVTPLVTFAGIGIALVLALGATVVVGKVLGALDSTSLTLEEVFVLGVGTDYSIFLVARYREELVHHGDPDDAIVQSVSWAGRSVATSGATAIIATFALAFSGVKLLSEWGSVLPIAILLTVLMSLTLIPAFLKLLGPRIFWPTTRGRFARQAARVKENLRQETTYFYRAGRFTQRRPLLVVGVVLLMSVPLVAVALEVPLAYDFYGQLPSGQPATNGLQTLYGHFGSGFATPSYALVTFAAPLVVGDQSNASEFVQVAALTARAENTSGIAAVSSLVGPDGAPLGTWLNLSTQPPVPRATLLATLGSFVGTDGRTVLLTLQPSATGLSENAVAAVRGVESSFSAYSASHPDVTQVRYGGGAPTIGDLADETAQATLLLLVAVAVGLVVVLVAVLRSWVIALLAIATIGLSITWAWAVTYLVFEQVLGFPLFFYVRTILFLLVLGLGIDYNIFVLSRVREERVRGRSSSEAVVAAVGRTGGIITAAALILACAFAALLVGEFTLIRAIGFSVAVAVLLDAMVVRTYLVPAALQLLGDRAWSVTGRRGAVDDGGPRASREDEAQGRATPDVSS